MTNPKQIHLNIFGIILFESLCMSKTFSLCTAVVIAFSLIACDGNNSNSSLTNPNQQDNEAVSSSSNGFQSATSSTANSSKESADYNNIEEDLVQKNDSSGLPSIYGECLIPVYWNPANTRAILNNTYSTGSDCDSLNIERQETWKYAFKYTKNDGKDTVIGYHTYIVDNQCLITRISATFTSTTISHIKKHGSSTLETAFISMCKDNECLSTMDIITSFKKVQEACLNIIEKNDVQIFRSFDEIAIDTTIYITQTAFDCEYKGLCD